MEPFDKDELSDRELDRLLPRWEAPTAPARLKAAVFPEPARPWWQRIWTASIRIPLPVACALAALVAFAATRPPRPAPPPRIVVKTERVEVPVIQERVVTRTVYRETAAAWQPVRELRPRIIRSAP